MLTRKWFESQADKNSPGVIKLFAFLSALQFVFAFDDVVLGQAGWWHWIGSVAFALLTVLFVGVWWTQRQRHALDRDDVRS